MATEVKSNKDKNKGEYKKKEKGEQRNGQPKNFGMEVPVPSSPTP